MILDNPIISGSSIVTGDLTVQGTLNASVSGSVTSASYATNAEKIDGLDSTSFTTTSSFTAYTASTNASILSNIQNIAILYTSASSLDSRVTKTEATASSLTTASSSFSTRVSASEASISILTTASGSFSTRTTNLETASGSFSTRVTSAEGSVSSLNSKSGSYATTGSNSFNGNQTITGSLITTGTITAQTLNVQQVTSSIVYSSGSNIFGNSVSNTQQMTGSLQVSGSNHYMLGKLGINTTSPSVDLTVVGNIKAGYDPAVGLVLGLIPSGVGVPNNNVNAFILWGDNATFGGNNGDLLYIPRSSTTGEHRFYTANTGLSSEKMRITYDGKVGIGITSPSYTLDVVGTIGTNQSVNITKAKSGTGVESYNLINLRVSGTGAIGDSGNIAWRSNDGSYTIASIGGISGADNIAYGSISFTTRNYFTDSLVEVMRITNRGNVGIGTTNPATKLDVNGVITSGTNSGSSINITTNGNNGTSGSPLQTNLNFYGYNSNLNGQIRVDDIAGTAQIGTMKFYTWNSAQVLALTLAHTGVATFASSVNALQFTATDGYGYNIGGFQVGAITSNRFYIYNNTLGIDNISINPSTGVTTFARGFIVNSGYNVGIGTTSPITKLSLGGYNGARLPYINGTSYTFGEGGITVPSSNNANAAIGGGIDLTNNTYSVGAYSPIISFSSLSSNSAYNNAYAGIWGVLGGQGVDANWVVGHLAFGTGGGAGITERMRITNDGNVGIGTTNISTEANLHLGAKGTAEGGQLILQKGTSQTYATHLDNYTDRFRVMSGTDTTSAAEKFSVSMSDGTVTTYGNILSMKSTGGGTYKQTVVGQITAAASGVAKKIAYVGHTHSIRVYVWANQSTGNGSSAIADIVTLYGSSNGGTVMEANFGNVTDISITYDNGGSPAYTVNVTLVYSGTAPAINYVIEGINNDNNIYTL